MSLRYHLKFAFLILLSIILTFSDSARILGLFPTHSKSHLIVHSAIADALAERGHNVTVVSTLPSVTKNPQYRYIQLDVQYPNFFTEMLKNPLPWYKRFTGFIDFVSGYANASLNQPQLKKLMAEESFDLVIQGYFFNEFLLGVAAHFKCPVIMSFTVRPFPYVNKLMGNPLELSYVPSLVGGGKQPMGFFDRLKNFLFIVFFENGIEEIYGQWRQSVLYRENFPSEKYPSYENMKKNVSLVFINHHFSQSPIRPDVPTMIEIGGIQIKDTPSPLPQDLKSILDNATEHGVIYFSLGTNIQSEKLCQDKIKILFDVLSKLPQTILWKWGDSKLPGNFENIVFRKWLPQNDILFHPNVKLFITHGGLGSVVESQYHGVPMVGIPILGDQPSNMKVVEKLGFGLSVDFITLTEADFSNKISEVLSNKTYFDNIQKFANRFKDRPMTPRQTALYWIEYVLRHHGAAHLQSQALHLNWIQLLSLDVVGVFVFSWFVSFKMIKIIYVKTKSKIKKEKPE
ncbi:UDP-glycosyltransferase UGT5-like [Episyrphus balteatus]|uniref:UDP-glycosyltransferase UGT5-like n=1 Tax=Episyrphus balteatus TaxID=286459 RepID=UPI0024865558|nr:UDP-glycosyltransferase UGT5-like [Episyrphus balteatus]